MRRGQWILQVGPGMLICTQYTVRVRHYSIPGIMALVRKTLHGNWMKFRAPAIRGTDNACGFFSNFVDLGKGGYRGRHPGTRGTFGVDPAIFFFARGLGYTYVEESHDNDHTSDTSGS
jgi:hypothetical protein